MAENHSSITQDAQQKSLIGASQQGDVAKPKRRTAKIKTVLPVPKPVPVNVVNLQAVRSARKMEARKPVNNSDEIRKDTNGEERRLLWVVRGAR